MAVPRSKLSVISTWGWKVRSGCWTCRGEAPGLDLRDMQKVAALPCKHDITSVHQDKLMLIRHGSGCWLVWATWQKLAPGTWNTWNSGGQSHAAASCSLEMSLSTSQTSLQRHSSTVLEQQLSLQSCLGCHANLTNHQQANPAAPSPVHKCLLSTVIGPYRVIQTGCSSSTW